MYDHKALCRGVAAALLISASGLHAAPTTYNYTITGDVLADLGSVFGLVDGDTITAYGTFTADDSYATNGGIVSFGAGSGNTMTIDLNGTLLDASLAAAPFVGVRHWLDAVRFLLRCHRGQLLFILYSI